MPHRLAAVAAALITLGLAAASPAAADCPVDNPDCGPGGEPVEVHTLTVTPPPVGTIVSTPSGIACPGDCSDKDTEPVTYTLVASGGPAGSVPQWSGCAAVTAGACTVTTDADRTVALTWRDVTGPAVVLSSPGAGAAVGTTVRAAATATDPSGVARVGFYVDGLPAATDTTLPFHADVSIGASAHGRAHTITAVALDLAGNTATSPSRTVVADRRADLVVGAVPATTTATVLPVTIDAEPGTLLTCHLDDGDPEACTSPYAPTLALGPHTYVIQAVDAFGNKATVARSFTVLAPAPPPTTPDPPAAPPVPGAPLAGGVTPPALGVATSTAPAVVAKPKAKIKKAKKAKKAKKKQAKRRKARRCRSAAKRTRPAQRPRTGSGRRACGRRSRGACARCGR